MKQTPEQHLANWRNLRKVTLLGMLVGIYPAYQGLYSIYNLTEFIFIEFVMLVGFIQCTSAIWKIKTNIRIMYLLKEIYKKRFGKDMPDSENNPTSDANEKDKEQ